MQCDAARQNLKALCDHELGVVAAWRVRRHLRHCAACRRELAMIERLNALLLSADPAGAGVIAAPRARIRGASNGSRGRLRWALQLASTALLVLVLALGFHARNSAPVGIPLAAAIEAFAGGKDWTTWHFVTRAPDGKVIETWLRRPDAFREESRQGSVLTELKVQLDQESWIYRVPEKRAYHAHSAIENPALYGDSVHELKDLQERARRVGGLRITRRSDRWPDGRAVKVIEIEADFAKHFGSRDEPHPTVWRSTVTVDAQTGLQLTSDREGYLTTTIAHNQPMPDRLFTWEPPAGVQVVEIGDWLGERLGRTLASVRNDHHSLTIHAADLAATGDVWVTASWRFHDESLNTWGTTPLFGDATDDRGRAYVAFSGILGGKLGPTGEIQAYTPREPRRPGDPYPTSIVLHHYGSPPLTVPVPPPAAWTRPPIDPVGVAHPERDAASFEKSRKQALEKAVGEGGRR
jgi:hypothetical protein